VSERPRRTVRLDAAEQTSTARSAELRAGPASAMGTASAVRTVLAQALGVVFVFAVCLVAAAYL
jgi:hypothetical protein